MALQKTIQLEGVSTLRTSIGVIENGTQSIEFPAYIKVISVSGDKTEVTAVVNFKNENKEFNKAYQVPVNNDDGNYIAQSYRYLKTLPEFEGAEDC